MDEAESLGWVDGEFGWSCPHAAAIDEDFNERVADVETNVGGLGAAVLAVGMSEVEVDSPDQEAPRLSANVKRTMVRSIAKRASR